MSMDNNRDKQIIRASVIGILANLFLAGFKAAIGLLSNSIAIVLDAVNNMSDAASSIITIVGTKLAGRQPDRKHPFGYGRIEYLTAMVISILVMYAGVTAFIESVKKIIKPDTPEYHMVSLVIVAVAVVVKIILGSYVKAVGKKVNSDALVNSGADALMDSIISASTLVAAVIFVLFRVSLEAWLGAVIALVIVKSGFEMIADTVSKLLGERVDGQLVRDIKETIKSFPEVSGAYDLVMHNYGPDSYNGSVHIEVPDTLTIDELDKLIRRIEVKVYREHKVILTAVSIYSDNAGNPEAIQEREKIRELVTSDPYVLQMHGFYMNKEDKMMRFDIVVSFDAKDRGSVYRQAVEKVKEAYPGYTVQIAMDIDFTDVD